MMPLPLENSNEMVAAAWIATIPGFSPAMTGEELPTDTDETGAPAAWLQTGFVTVATVGGTPDDMLPIHRPVIEVKCWAAVPGSNKPPWNMAKTLASAVQRAVWQHRNIARPVHVNINGRQYPTAVVKSAFMAQEFRKVYADAGDYACYQGDMGMQWITVGDHLD